MNLLDLYETREPYQQAIDRLEARRIEDLNAKMDDLIARARTAKTPEHKAGLTREFQKCKDERDGYYKIKEQQVPNNTAPAQKGIGDLQDPKQKMAQLQQKAKKGPLANVGAGLKAFFKGEPEPMDEEQVDQSSAGPRAFGVANFQRLLKANMGNLPTVTLEFANPEDAIKLDKAAIDLVSDYYDGLDSDSAKNYFIYRVLPSADETSTVLQKLGLPGKSSQGELALEEKKKSSTNEPIKSADVKVDRELQKLRAQYPAAGSDLEAVAASEIDNTERSQRQLSAIRGANDKQDALLKQLVQLDQDQGREIDGLDQENNTLEKRLAQIQSTNDQLQQTIGQMTGTKKSTVKTNKIGKADANVGGIIDVGPTGAPTPSARVSADQPASQPVKQQPTTSAAIGNMSQQIQGFDRLGPAPSIRLQPANDAQQQTAAESVDYDEEDMDTDLHSGDYVRDRQDGESGEVFRMLGDPEERRVRILDRDGLGWYITPDRLTRVDSQDPAIQRYFGKKRVRDMDEQGVAETALNPNKPKDDYEAKRRALHDLSLNKGVDQAAVQQRRLDLDREAKAKGVTEEVDKAGALKAAQAAAKFMLRNLDDRAALKDYSMHFWSPTKFYQGATMAMRGVGYDEIVQHITQDQPKKDVDEGIMKEPTNRKEYLDQRDKLFRMMAVDSNPSNKQIIKQALQDLEARYGNLKNTVKEAEAIPAKMVMQSFVIEYDPATRTVVIGKRNQELDRFQFKGVPSLVSFQRTINTRIKNLENDLYGDSDQDGAVSLSRVKIPGRGYGYQDLGEQSTTSGEAVEIAIIKRILVAHTDLIMEFGLDKVTQAIEEVAYNVGDVDEIGTSDVSAYVHQVKQILGVPENLDEKWSAKYKSSINCANPKGFSQKAHCAGKKK